VINIIRTLVYFCTKEHQYGLLHLERASLVRSVYILVLAEIINHRFPKLSVNIFVAVWDFSFHSNASCGRVIIL